MSKIGIISIYAMPIGLAATNRILAYSKSLAMLNNEVDIICISPTDIKSKYLSEGYIDSIHYIYPAGREKARYKILRFISIYSGYRYIHSLFCSISYIIKGHRQNRFDYLLISNDSIIYLYVYAILSKILKIKSVFIFDEYPIPIRHKLKEKIPQWKTNLYKTVLRHINGYISISEKLENFYCGIIKKQTLVLPIIIDTDRFKSLSVSKSSIKQNLCYMGNMELSKDNIDIIIKAFASICHKYPNLQFNLYGSPNIGDYNSLVNLITSLNVQDRVIFNGRVSSNDVPRILMNSTILVSSQPQTRRAAGGFPTKLGEYLCSGVPTILTDVGENARYVTNNQHCYFVKPNNINEYADKIDYILSHYEDACRVALQGKEYIQKKYSVESTGEKMINFFNTLN